MWYIKQWLCLWYQTLYVHDIFTLYGITHSVMTTNHWVPSKPLCLILPSNIFDITKNVPILWQGMYVNHHSLYMYDIICTTYDITSTLYDITHLIYGVTSTISNITSTLCYLMSTVSVQPHPLYQWYHSHPIYDITYGICVTAYPRCLWYHIHYVRQHNTACCWYRTRHMCDIFALQMISNPLYHSKTTIFMMSHPLRAWHHNHSIRHRTHCIFVITTSPLISYPLLYDIIPTISVTSYALYITSYQLLRLHTSVLMTLEPLYMKPHPICRATYTLYVWHNSHYSVSSLSLHWQHHTHPVWHHTHSVWHHIRHLLGILCTIQDITYLLYDIKPPFLKHHTHYIWLRIYCTRVITSTVLMISHQLNFWDLIRYIWWHNIHCILHHSH